MVACYPSGAVGWAASAVRSAADAGEGDGRRGDADGRRDEIGGRSGFVTSGSHRRRASAIAFAASWQVQREVT
jgi:hypothetical protein